MQSKGIKVGRTYQVRRPVYVKGFKTRDQIEIRVCDRIDTSGKSPLFTMRNLETGMSADVFARDVICEINQ